MLTKKQLMEVLDLVTDDTIICVWVPDPNGNDGEIVMATDVHIEPGAGILIGTEEE